MPVISLSQESFRRLASRERVVTALRDAFERIESPEAELRNLSYKKLSRTTAEFKDWLRHRENSRLREAFAVSHQGKTAQMTTEERETLVGTLPAYLARGPPRPQEAPYRARPCAGPCGLL